METERDILLEDNNEAVSGHKVIAGSFEEAILLTGQALNSITYQRQLNVLNTLIDNSTRAKKILKGRSLGLDDTKKSYFFGEKFEEKPIKSTSAKQFLQVYS